MLVWDLAHAHALQVVSFIVNNIRTVDKWW